jgi:hypothetical protein
LISLARDSWHVRLFKASTSLWMQFLRPRDKWMDFLGDYARRTRRTNVCSYLRMILVQAPLVILLHLGVIALGVMALLVYPYVWFGMEYVWFWATLLGFVIVGIAFIWVLFGLVPAAWGLMGAGAVYVADAARSRRRSKGPGLLSLIWQWIRDRHDRICSIIEIRD